MTREAGGVSGYDYATQAEAVYFSKDAEHSDEDELVYLLDKAKDAFDVILQVGAGTGLLYLVRWFWWRITAWCEVVAVVVEHRVDLHRFG